MKPYHKIISYYNHEVYQLNCNKSQLLIDSSDGLTAISYIVNSIEYIWYSKERYESGATYGIPILYPTPNRVSNSICHFHHEVFPAIMHGVARKQSFTNLQITSTDSSISISGELHFNKECDYFKYFPFTHILKMKITLTENHVIWNYEVINLDEKPLGFGIALHPFFNTHTNCSITSNASCYMHSDQHNLPNGAYSPVLHTPYDLNDLHPIDTLNLDTVYYHTQDTQLSSKISYPTIGTQLIVESDSLCNHCVIFTPQKQPFVCVEPQTCSTDCHNLYHLGFIKESNLIIVEPNQIHSGYFKINIQNYQQE